MLVSINSLSSSHQVSTGMSDVRGFDSCPTMLLFNQPPRSTQPCHPSVVGAVGTSESCGVNRHAMQYTSPGPHSVSWCLTNGFRIGDQHCPVHRYGSGRTLFYFFLHKLCTLLCFCEGWSKDNAGK